jgi:hypothetical protein
MGVAIMSNYRWRELWIRCSLCCWRWRDGRTIKWPTILVQNRHPAPQARMLAVAGHGFARPVGGSWKMNETYIRLADAGGTSKRGCNATLHDGEIDLRQVNGRCRATRHPSCFQ